MELKGAQKTGIRTACMAQSFLQLLLLDSFPPSRTLRIRA